MAVAVTTASAADLPVKASIAPPIQYSWTGCYVGGHVGGVVSQDTNVSSLGLSNDYGSAGFVGGGQAGCNYQFAPNWVIGAEGRAAWTSLENRHNGSVRFQTPSVTVPAQFHLANDFLASATARLGYVYAEHWVFYARGGAAWTHEKVDIAFVLPVVNLFTDPSATASRLGWTAGAGVEWAFAPRWSVNLEYNYYYFGQQGFLLTSTAPVNAVTLAGLKDTIHAATIGVNFHF